MESAFLLSRESTTLSFSNPQKGHFIALLAGCIVPARGARLVRQSSRPHADAARSFLRVQPGLHMFDQQCISHCQGIDTSATMAARRYIMSVQSRLFTVFMCLGFALPSFCGERQWVEIHSPHFSVITDAGERRGRDVAVRFEQMRVVFGALMAKANVNIPVPLQIVAFRNSKEFLQFSPIFQGKASKFAGLFQGGSD